MVHDLCRRSGRFSLLAAAALLLSLCVSQHGHAEGVKLAKGVPADAFVFTNWKANPERAYMKEYTDRVMAEFKASGIMKDIQGIFTEMVPAEARGQMEGPMKMAAGMLTGVEWSALVEKSTVWAMRMGPMGPININLFEVDAAKLPPIVERMGKIFDTVVGMAPMMTRVNEVKEGSPTVHGIAAPGMPVGAFIATHGNILVFSNDRGTLDKSLQLLASSDGAGSIVTSPRLKAALAKVPAAEDSLMFFDISTVVDYAFEQAENELKTEIPADMPEETKTQIKAQLTQARELMEFARSQIDIVDYIVDSKYTEGYRNLGTMHTQFLQSAGDSLCMQLTGNQPTFANFQNHVPKDASSFSLNAGIDLSALYHFAMKVVKERVPGGAEQIAEWEKMQKDVIGFNVHDTILANIRGDSISVTFPSGQANPFGGSSNTNVSMFGVRNGEKLGQLLAGALENAGKMAMQRGLPLTIRKADVVEGGAFHTIQMPMMPFVQPVIGIYGDYLYYGKDAAAIKRITDLAKNPADNILQNPRFAKLGLTPSTPVSKISYKNLEKSYQETAQMLSQMGMMMGMVSGMLSAQLPAGNKEQKEMIMNMIMKATEIMPKLGPVIAKIDYYQDTASFSYYDKASNAMISRTATSIRPPKKKTEAATQ